MGNESVGRGHCKNNRDGNHNELSPAGRRAKADAGSGRTGWKSFPLVLLIVAGCSFLVFHSCSDRGTTTSGLADLKDSPHVETTTLIGPSFFQMAPAPAPCISPGPGMDDFEAAVPLRASTPSDVLPSGNECMSRIAEPLRLSSSDLLQTGFENAPAGAEPELPPGVELYVTETTDAGETPDAFQADNPPAAAELIAPSGEVSETRPTFEWNAVETSTWYRVWVRDSGTMSGSPRIHHWVTASDAGCGEGTGTCSWTANTDLIGGDATWWIQTWNNAGEGPWSDGMDFSVPGTSSPPPAATLIGPDTQVDTERPTFEWNAVETSTWYRVWVRDSGTMSGDPRIAHWVTASDAGCGGGTGTCSWTANEDLTDGNARWWVRTWNEVDTGPWSDAMDFSVATTPPPAAATLSSPDGVVQTTQPTFEWEAEENSTWYQVWVRDSGTMSGNPRIAHWVTASDAGCGEGTGMCSWTAATHLSSGNATWWIRTWNPTDYGPWSDGMEFEVDVDPPPAATLNSPSGDVHTPRPTFEWNAVEEATWYRVWVRDSETMSGDPVIAHWITASDAGCGEGTGTCSWTADTDLAEGEGTWWILTWNPVGNGPWSDGMDITVSSTDAISLSVGETFVQPYPCDVVVLPDDAGSVFRVGVMARDYRTTGATVEKVPVDLMLRSVETGASPDRLIAQTNLNRNNPNSSFQDDLIDKELLELMKRTEELHHKLRQQEIEETVDGLNFMPGGEPSRLTPAAPEDMVMDHAEPEINRTFFANNPDGPGRIEIDATLRKNGTNILYYQDDSVEGTDEEATEQEIEKLLDYYDNYGKPLIDEMFGGLGPDGMTNNFAGGERPANDIDENGKFIVLQLHPDNMIGNAAGYVTSCDRRPRPENYNAGGWQCTDSNEAEITYLLRPDSDFYLGTLVHEAKHISSHGYAVFADRGFQPSWIEEGTAEIAKEMSSRHAAGYTDTQKLTYGDIHPLTPETFGMRTVHVRAMQFLSASPQSGVIGNPNPNPENSTYYGASWIFHRYLADNYQLNNQNTFFKEMNDGTLDVDIAGLEAATGQSFAELLNEFIEGVQLEGFNTAVNNSSNSFITYDYEDIAGPYSFHFGDWPYLQSSSDYGSEDFILSPVYFTSPNIFEFTSQGGSTLALELLDESGDPLDSDLEAVLIITRVE